MGCGGGRHLCKAFPRAALGSCPASSSMAAKLTPMQLRAATQRRNSYITAGVAFGLVGGVYYYTMQAMSGASLAAVGTAGGAACCVLCGSLRVTSIRYQSELCGARRIRYRTQPGRCRYREVPGDVEQRRCDSRRSSSS